MVFFPTVLHRLVDYLLYKILANSCATKVRNHGIFQKSASFKSSPSSPIIFPSITKCAEFPTKSETVVCDINGCLIRSQPSFFPFFMLVAFEGGGILRAMLLLLSCPVSWFLDHESALRVMIFVTFCGMKIKDMDNVMRAVLPKFYLENINFQVYEVLASAGNRLVLTSLPRVMVEGFLKEYLNVESVRGTELQTRGKCYTGFLAGSGLLVKHRALKEQFSGEKRPDFGIGNATIHDQLFISQCKEGYVVTKEDNKPSHNSVMPRERYPKPLVFHDGRLAFLPTPLATLIMFMWIPVGIILAIFRLTIGIFLPFKVAHLLGTASGVIIRFKGPASETYPSPETGRKGVLYVCTHRTLLDPVFLSTTLSKPLTAVTYSLSKVSEVLSPIQTVRLTRDRQQDAATMNRLLSEGDLVVCPEGTTCREPYLLRFSSLFAELAEEIVPVAINTSVSMFYGTTASGLKCLDPIFFLMNPRPCYMVHVLGKLPKEMTVGGGKTSHEVANYIQKQLGGALGFECTGLTRRDKYLMLAGNEGVVQQNNNKFRD